MQCLSTEVINDVGLEMFDCREQYSLLGTVNSACLLCAAARIVFVSVVGAVKETSVSGARVFETQI